MVNRADLMLGLFAGFVIGLLVGVWLFKAGILATQPAKQYGVRYEYDEKGRLTNVIPVPVPG